METPSIKSNQDLDNLFGDNDKNEDSASFRENSSSPIKSVEKILSNPAPELLNDTQRLLILKRWEQDSENPPSIEELCELACPGEKLDGRSKIGREIKKYLSEKDLRPQTKTEYKPKGLLTLTEEQKEFIRNNPNMRANEIAQALWNNLFFANNSQEVLTVKNYQQELEKENKGFKRTIEDSPDQEYRPPKTFDHTAARINKYIKDSGLDSGNLNAAQKKCCKMLISYLHSFRLNHQINSFSKQDDRDLFESVFVSYCYDKPDLTREDIDKMVILATESVISSNKLRMIELLQNEMQKSLDENSNVKIGIVDSISTINTEYNSSVKRQRDLYNDLNEKRSERLRGKLKETASVLNLVELWKNEETRIKMIKIANQKKEKLKEEIDRLSNMDDLIGIVAGLDKSEILNN